jgi:hypothetical protein
MAALYIQLRQSTAQREHEQECTLDGVRTLIRARYLALGDRWYVSLLSTARVLIVGPLAGVPGVDLLLPYHHLVGVPAGQLFVSGVARAPLDLVNLDVTARLVYREA